MPTSQKAKNSLIFQIQRFSLDDGPGIRTTIFFKGCNLRCIWCHNPESIRPQAELALRLSLCTRCGACATVCPNGAQVCDERGRFLDRTVCVGCLACVEACPSGALSAYGQEMTVDQVFGMIFRDSPFYAKSGGGVTFSGGEPLLQEGFLTEMLRLCQAHNLHTAVDTAGNVPFERFLAVLPYTNLFLYDIKSFDPKLHQRCTGVDNNRILSNLKRLSKYHTHVWVRLPFIPGFNDGHGEIEAIAALLKDIPAIEKIELLPFHAYGEAKYEQMGIARGEEERRVPTRPELLGILDEYKSHGLLVECPTL